MSLGYLWIGSVSISSAKSSHIHKVNMCFLLQIPVGVFVSWFSIPKVWLHMFFKSLEFHSPRVQWQVKSSVYWLFWLLHPGWHTKDQHWVINSRLSDQNFDSCSNWFNVTTLQAAFAFCIDWVVLVVLVVLVVFVVLIQHIFTGIPRSSFYDHCTDILRFAKDLANTFSVQSVGSSMLLRANN